MRVSSARRLAKGLSLLRLMWPNWKGFPKRDSWKDTSASLPRPLYKSLIKVFVADTRIALVAQLVNLFGDIFIFPQQRQDRISRPWCEFTSSGLKCSRTP